MKLCIVIVLCHLHAFLIHPPPHAHLQKKINTNLEHPLPRSIGTAEKEELQQVELGDFVKVKQVLDEAVVKAVFDKDYKEDYRWDNIKLVLMVVACLFAMVAQFYPMPFPESRPLLGICCAAYFVASSVLQLIVTYIEKDCIMITMPAAGPKAVAYTKEEKEAAKSRPGGQLNMKRAGGEVGLRICTNFPRFSYDFTVTVIENVPEKDQKSLNAAIDAAASGSKPTEKADKFCSMTFKINKYFTETGDFNEENFEDHVTSVIEDFENGVFYFEKSWEDRKKKQT